MHAVGEYGVRSREHLIVSPGAGTVSRIRREGVRVSVIHIRRRVVEARITAEVGRPDYPATPVRARVERGREPSAADVGMTIRRQLGFGPPLDRFGKPVAESSRDSLLDAILEAD
jgi:hypothetical protein